MKILQVNKFFYHKGGTETYLFALIELLKNHDQEVAVFSQKNPQNRANNEEKYFLNPIDLEKFHWQNIFKIGRIFWSYAASRQIKKVIKATSPDLVHLHNIYHQLSPSILPAIKSFGLPIVMTVHDFKLVKYDYALPINQKKSRHKNSRLADWLLKAEFTFHRRTKIYQKYVDLFIAPSEFVKNELIAAGFDVNKICVLPHFLDLPLAPEAQPIKKENTILYFGRLDESKGVDILIRAFAGLAAKYPAWQLKIIGSGPKENEWRELAEKLKIINQIIFIPQLPKKELGQEIQKAQFAVAPSRLHETFGLSVAEALAYGLPVVATKNGGYQELIQDNENGFLVPSEDVLAIQEKMEQLIINTDLREKMSEAAKISVAELTPEKHYQEIIKIYKKFVQTEKNSTT